jgi:predicted DCC family thiol-disulfide oxidoreductase YuxK
MPPTHAKPIVFFDGVCNMCNFFASLLLRVDKQGIFLLAPLQGETARAMLPRLPEHPEQWSMVYLDETGIYDLSDAAIKVYRRLGGAWYLLSLARYIPRWIRDPAYRMLARNRYRWFGTRDTCRLPTESEKQRFLP